MIVIVWVSRTCLPVALAVNLISGLSTTMASLTIVCVFSDGIQPQTYGLWGAIGTVQLTKQDEIHRLRRKNKF